MGGSDVTGWVGRPGLVNGSETAGVWGRLADGWLAGDSYNTRVRGRMAHKIGPNDTQYEPDIRGEVDFCCLEASDVERTKSGEGVGGSAALSCVIGSSSSAPGASCLVDSRYRCVEDTSSSGQQASRRRPIEGHQGSEEVSRHEDSGPSVSSGSNTPGKVGSAGSLEAQQQGASAVMEHVDPNPYSSDEWDESDLSDTDDDHSDSSDDDDPKSQVDRLIERETLVYMEGENSNLSSETDSSDDSSDYDDSDSESDITDVSPLLSATASPLGLSPVLPRRTLGTSPLALHDNRDLTFDFQHENSSNDHGYDTQTHCNGCNSNSGSGGDSTDMTLLLKAVVQLEKQQQQQRHVQHRTCEHTQQSHPITIHPIDASPHHRHLRRTMHHHRRKNMSFTNDEVRRIDRENQILLEKIMSAHSRSKSSSSHSNRPVHKPANSTVNRRREDEKIRRENMVSFSFVFCS